MNDSLTASVKAVRLLELLFAKEELERDGQNAFGRSMESGRETGALDSERMDLIMENILQAAKSSDKSSIRSEVTNAINKKLAYYRRLKRLRENN